eukprot:m.131034 g.131034  ORF g.131034 m.131034 type:complete len:279 (-) comp23715_c0_seq12:2430-3266(-)
MSGRRPDRTRCWDFHWNFRDGPAGPSSGSNWTSLPEYFKNHGFFTSGVGKTFHPNVPPNFDFPRSWNEPCFDQKKAECVGDVTFCSVPGNDSMDSNFVDTLLTNVSLGRLEKIVKTKPDQPFFMAVGLRNPHIPYRFPPEFGSLYPPSSKFQVPKNKDSPHDAPPIAWWWPFEVDDLYKGPNATWEQPLSDTYSQNLRHAYYSVVSYTDSQVGRLLDKLEDLGVANDTMIVLFGDHGQNLGEVIAVEVCKKSEQTKESSSQTNKHRSSGGKPGWQTKQ